MDTPSAPGAPIMSYERLPWTDYFNQPTVDQLKGRLKEEAVKLFDGIRARLTAIEGVSERFKWFGDGWHWTIGYFTGNSEEPLAVIIPNPADLQLSMPLDRKFIKGLPEDQVAKTLRDGLELAADPFDTRWAVWSIENEPLIEDLVRFVEMKRQFMARAAG
jgi:hypothetical protein